jgi:Fic family protein
MDEFFYEINHYGGSPISLAAYTHLRIAKIHPFLDGNGRVARLMMNYQLIRHGYLPVSIPVERRKEYFDLLENYKMNKQQEPFDQFVGELVEAEYDRLILVMRTLQ